MPKYVVLKTLPKGQQPGDTVELNDDEARVFLLVEAVREPDAFTPAELATKPKRRYGRRDLEAEA